MKKAISPLIATVILISFAVALGAVIMSIGMNLEQTFDDKGEKCDGVGFNVYKFVTGKWDMCYDETSLIFTVVGTSGSIDNLKIVAYTTGDELFEVDRVLMEKLIAGSRLRVKVPYKQTRYGDVLEVELFPIIDKDYVCINHSLIISPVDSCAK